jgi:hypothetical protein
MAFYTLPRGTRREMDGTMITIGKQGRIMMNSNLSRAVRNKNATRTFLLFDPDSTTLRLKLLKLQGNNPDAYRLTSAKGGGKDRTPAIAVQAKTALDEIGYDYATTKVYEAKLDANKLEIDVLLAAERIRRR